MTGGGSVWEDFVCCRAFGWMFRVVYIYLYIHFAFVSLRSLQHCIYTVLVSHVLREFWNLNAVSPSVYLTCLESRLKAQFIYSSKPS